MLNRFDFVSQLVTKFAPKQWKNDSDEIVIEKKKEKEQFFNDLNRFCDECIPTGLIEVFNYIDREHDTASIPKMAKLWKYAKKHDLIIKKDVRRNPYWYICTNCKTEYSKEGRGCPKCRCTDSIIKTGDTLPDDLIEVQADCFYCNIYPESVKKENERKLYFTGCEYFGINHTPQCSACECKECCRQMIMYNADPRGTTEKYKSTELAMPWIKEVTPLNETAQAMMDNIINHRGR